MVHLDIPLIIRSAPEEVHKWQIVDVEKLVRKFQKHGAGKLYKMLEIGYPRMYIHVMTQIGMHDKVKEYREECC